MQCAFFARCCATCRNADFYFADPLEIHTMKQTHEKKPMPLWAIWLITIVGVLAWCGTHPDEGTEPAWPVQSTHRA